MLMVGRRGIQSASLADSCTTISRYFVGLSGSSDVYAYISRHTEEGGDLLSKPKGIAQVMR